MEKEIEDGPQDVDLDLVVLVLVSIRIDEHLEIVLMKDDHVPLVVGRPEIRLLHDACDIEKIIVPEHLGLGAKMRNGPVRSLDVSKITGP